VNEDIFAKNSLGTFMNYFGDATEKLKCRSERRENSKDRSR